MLNALCVLWLYERLFDVAWPVDSRRTCGSSAPLTDQHLTRATKPVFPEATSRSGGGKRATAKSRVRLTLSLSCKPPHMPTSLRQGGCRD